MWILCNNCGKNLEYLKPNQIVFTPFIKVIPFSKYLSFHLGVVLVHANRANLILVHRLIGYHLEAKNRNIGLTYVDNCLPYV